MILETRWGMKMKEEDSELRVGRNMGLGVGNGEWLPMGTGFPSEVMESFWNCIEGLVVQHYKWTKYH